MPTIPSKEEIKLMEAQHYANLLKLEELKKQGVDVEKLQQLRKEVFGNGIFDHKQKEVTSESELSSTSSSESEQEDIKQKEFAMEYYADAFEDFRVKILIINFENYFFILRFFFFFLIF